MNDLGELACFLNVTLSHGLDRCMQGVRTISSIDQRAESCLWIGPWRTSKRIQREGSSCLCREGDGDKVPEHDLECCVKVLTLLIGFRTKTYKIKVGS